MTTNEYAGNALPSASFGDDREAAAAVEILASTSGWTQKGVTLKPGLGILPAGTVLGQVTATKLWAPYNQAASNGAGSDTARGVLRQAVDTGGAGTTKTYVANILIQGILKLAVLSGADANAISDLNARSDAVLGTFSF